MNRILVVLTFFAVVIPSFSLGAECADPDVPFFTDRAVTENKYTQILNGLTPDKKDIFFTRWRIFDDTTMTAIFYKGKFVGLITLVIRSKNPSNAESLKATFIDWEKLFVSYGFQFSHDGKETKKGMEEVFREFSCPEDKNMRLRLSLIRDTEKPIIMLESSRWVDKEETGRRLK